MSSVKAYDGSSFQLASRIQAYDGSAWRDIKRVQVYDGANWQDATPAMLSSLTIVCDTIGDPTPQWHAELTWISTAVGSYRYRWREEANPYSSWTTVNAPTSPDTTSISGTGTAIGNAISVQVEPYTGASLGGDAGPVYFAIQDLT